jgi:general stress protein 26
MNETKDETKKTLIELLRGFDNVMVATNAGNGTMHARPMAVAAVEDNGEVWFVTEDFSDKVDEVESDHRAVVTGQGKTAFVSLSGEIDLIRDRERVRALWKDSWKVWFPEGKDDPDILLMRLRPDIGEYWDNRGMKGVRYLFEAARSLLDGDRPSDDRARHAKVPM